MHLVEPVNGSAEMLASDDGDRFRTVKRFTRMPGMFVFSEVRVLYGAGSRNR